MKVLDRYLQKRRFKIAGKMMIPGSKLLDIGCSYCELFSFMKEKRIHGYGIDQDANVSGGQLPENVVFIKSSFPSTLLNGNYFDYITALAVLEHIPSESLPDFSNACYDLLKPGGKLIITVPSPLVDYILSGLQFVGLVAAETLHQHYGFKVSETIPIFSRSNFKLVTHRRFQLGLNNLFVFEK